MVYSIYFYVYGFLGWLEGDIGRLLFGWRDRRYLRELFFKVIIEVLEGKFDFVNIFKFLLGLSLLNVILIKVWLSSVLRGIEVYFVLLGMIIML